MEKEKKQNMLETADVTSIVMVLGAAVLVVAIGTALGIWAAAKLSNS